MDVAVTAPFPPSRVYVFWPVVLYSHYEGNSSSSLKILLDILLLVHVVHIWCSNFVATIFAASTLLSGLAYFSSNCTTSAAEFFQLFQVRVFAFAWPFLPLVVPVADQIVVSAVDKTTLILLLLPHPDQSFDTLTDMLSFALLFPVDSEEGRQAGTWG